MRVYFLARSLGYRLDDWKLVPRHTRAPQAATKRQDLEEHLARASKDTFTGRIKINQSRFVSLEYAGKPGAARFGYLLLHKQREGEVLRGSVLGYSPRDNDQERGDPIGIGRIDLKKSESDK